MELGHTISEFFFFEAKYTDKITCVRYKSHLQYNYIRQMKESEVQALLKLRKAQTVLK